MGVEVGADDTDSNVGTMLIANAFHMAMGVAFLALGAGILVDTATATWGSATWALRPRCSSSVPPMCVFRPSIARTGSAGTR